MRCSLRLKLKEYKRFTILLFLQFFSIILFSQVKISGKVTGVDGQGIPLVSVQIRNTSFGTTTDNSGNFELDASLNPGNYTIEFSGIGFKTSQQTITVGNEKSYTANMRLAEDALKLDEVVVIGSSLTQSRKQLGNSINSVSGRQLQNTGSGNLAGALQG